MILMSLHDFGWRGVWLLMSFPFVLWQGCAGNSDLLLFAMTGDVTMRRAVRRGVDRTSGEVRSAGRNERDEEIDMTAGCHYVICVLIVAG